MKIIKSGFGSYVAKLLAVSGLLAGASQAAVFVDFSGGAGSSLQITLPSISFVVNSASALNFDSGFGIGIAVGQEPANTIYNSSSAGSAALFGSSNPALVFNGASGYYFFTNSISGGPNNGGIVWYGEEFSANAVNGDVITFNGGTISSTGAVAEAFADGNYEIYLIAGASGAVSSTAGVASVPEPSLDILAAAGMLGCCVLRKRIA